MDRRVDVFLHEAFADDDRVFEVVAVPGHEADQDVAAQGQLTRVIDQEAADSASGNKQALHDDYISQNRIQNSIDKLNGSVTELAGQRTDQLFRVQSPAAGAAQLAPNTKRNTAIGVILGLVIGIGLVFAREAFDTRIRSAEQVAAELGLPLFGRLPRPDKDMRKHDQLTLLADPHGIHSEAYKKLRVSLDFANLDPQAQMLLVTSAVAQEGKSTTAANLAVAMAASGKNVILVDLDLRAPYLDRFFGLTGRPGVTDVILGTRRSTRRSSRSSCRARPILARAATGMGRAVGLAAARP